ncbi:MAG: hypothetical protein R3F61_15465 [Myxococcota bacterium]
MLLAWLLACGTPSTPGEHAAPDGAHTPQPVEVAEAFDVPPPPGHRTVRIHGLSPEGLELGAMVALCGPDGTVLARGDLVDHSVQPPSLTLYVPEADVDVLFSQPFLTARPDR